jgi:putative oxidoreductase
MASQSENSSHPLLSYADSLAVMWQDFLLLVGRILLGWIFFQSGWNKLFSIAQYSTTFPRRGLRHGWRTSRFLPSFWEGSS